MEDKNIVIQSIINISNDYEVTFARIKYNSIKDLFIKQKIEYKDLIDFILEEKINEIDEYNIDNPPISRIFTPGNILENNEELIIKMYLENKL